MGRAGRVQPCAKSMSMVQPGPVRLDPSGAAVLKRGGAPRRGVAGAKGLDTVKLIMAVIKPFKVDDVRESLTAAGIDGLTITEVKGYGRQKGQTVIYRGAEYAINFLPKVKVEVVVSDDVVERAVEVLRAAAHTGKIGDGKVFVLDVEQAVRIRTGETGAAAL